MADSTSSPDLVTLVEQEIQKVLADIKADLSDGHFSLSEIVSIVTELVQAGMAVSTSVAATGGEAAVLAAVIKFYDAEIAPLGAKQFGTVIEKAVIDPVVHQLVPVLIKAAADAVAAASKSV